MIHSRAKRAPLVVAAVLLASCSGSSSVPAMQASSAGVHSKSAPVLLVVSPDGTLKYYPVTPDGGRDPQLIAKLPGIRAAGAMVSYGHGVAFVQQHPPSVVLYNIPKKNQRVLADPYGTPIDVAADDAGNVYALNASTASAPSNVVAYAPGSSQAQELTCSRLGDGIAIAADREGDVFVNGYGSSSAGVVEIPNASDGSRPRKCKTLALQPEQGYVAGVAVDPKGEDLIVVDDPGVCSGGIEGQMTIYPKPYKARTGHSADLHGRCVGLIRLDATTNTVFALDRTSAFAYAFVIGRGYPDGSGDATYRHRYLGGFTPSATY